MENEDLLVLGEIGFKKVCKEGYILVAHRGRYAIHYDVLLAYKDTSNDFLFLNKKIIEGNGFSKTDLKTIRALDSSFRKKGDKFYSDEYKIKVIEFYYQYRSI